MKESSVQSVYIGCECNRILCWIRVRKLNERRLIALYFCNFRFWRTEKSIMGPWTHIFLIASLTIPTLVSAYRDDYCPQCNRLQSSDAREECKTTCMLQLKCMECLDTNSLQRSMEKCWDSLNCDSLLTEDELADDMFGK